MRFIVEEAVTGVILTRDLQVREPKLVRRLTGYAELEFAIAYQEPSVEGIRFRAYGQIIHVEKIVNGTRKIIASCIVQPTEMDDNNGTLMVRALGFSSYPEEIPWLQNYNPIAVDPFEIVQRIWTHVQSYPQGNMNVLVTPASSGTLLLPGFGFDGIKLVIEFFAIFVRAVDFRDCGKEISKLARDIPFDYLEVSEWNADRTAINKRIELDYPKRGVKRTALSFRFRENIIDGVPTPESQIEWTSDVIIRGWWPGRVYSSNLANADPKRFRRVMMEEDAKINSRERSAVWARRKLKRRQVPSYWSSITIDMHHPNAPFGSWDLGDSIYVEGFMPWVGNVKAWHRIVAYMIDEASGLCQLELKHEGAFNYDPLELEFS